MQTRPLIQTRSLQRRHLKAATEHLSDPIFILAPPRSFSSVVGAMIGQHPQLYGCPELQIFGSETVFEWWESCGLASFPMAHGLLRAVAQICFGEQTERSVSRARGWLRRRSNLSTGYIVEELMAKIHPLVLVEKSPSIVYRLDAMRRAHALFPDARYIHLLRHPRGHAESVMKGIRELGELGPVPQWWINLASFPEPANGSAPAAPAANNGQIMDPQNGWHALHSNICRFLESIPDSHKLQMRGEDVLADPDHSLRKIADWLGLRTDPQAIEAMKHPEKSVYACFGPPSARLGNDANFLQNPALRPEKARTMDLQAPLSWRTDGKGFAPEIQRLAMRFGYL